MKLLFLIFYFLLFAPAWAWGPVGHETVAFIAEDNLSPQTKKAVYSLLEPGETMAGVSNWADKIRFTAKKTAPWHFIDLPVRQELSIEAVRDFSANNPCVVSALEKQISILKRTNEPRYKRQEALKYVIHFVGDLHQPLHCFDDGDRGGNEKIVRFKTPGRRGRGSKMKLHQLWDELIEVHTVEDPRVYASALENSYAYAGREAWTAGDFSGWAFETWQIDHGPILAELEADGMGPGPGDYSHSPLPMDYYNRMRPIVDKQILRAGVRLAIVLNGVFDGGQ